MILLWLTDLRKTALIACTASVIGLVIPMWGLTQQMSVLESRSPASKWWMISITVLVPLYTAILPAFYFALSRNEGSLRFPKRLRLLALLAALITGIIAIAGLPEWIKSLRSYLASPMFDWTVGASTILTFARDPRTISQFAILLGEVSNIAYVLMLIAMFRQQSDGLKTGAPISRLLNRATKAAVIAWGLVVVAVLLGLLLTPYTFYTIRKDVLQMGRTSPGFGYFFVRQLRTVLQQASLLAAPYVVYRALRDQVDSAIDAQSEPPESVS